MTSRDAFDWASARRLGLPSVLVATFGPSAVAFLGFRGLLPRLVARGWPPVAAWPLLAAAMLTGFGAFTWWILARDARLHGVSLRRRACLQAPTARQWGLSVAVILGSAVAVAGVMPVAPGLMRGLGIEVPDYMPFWLKGLSPADVPPEVLSPGLVLKGAYWMLPAMAYVLAVNVLVEDLYFRAWLLPRMSWMGSWAWVVNGTLFALYHTFQPWLLPAILIGSLGFAFLVWRTRSVVPSLVAHLVLNLAALLGLLQAIR